MLQDALVVGLLGASLGLSTLQLWPSGLAAQEQKAPAERAAEDGPHQ